MLGLAISLLSIPVSSAGPVPSAAPDVAAVSGRWSTSSCVAIGPRHVLSTRHQWDQDGTGAVVIFGDTRHAVVRDHRHPTLDLRVSEIDGELAAWVPLLYLLPAEGERLELAGYGAPAGEAIESEGKILGYRWDEARRNTFGFGFNRVRDTSATHVGARFDPPGFGEAGEASHAAGDSGSGWFVRRGGVLWLAGITRAVQYPGSARYGEQSFAVPAAAAIAWVDSIVAQPCVRIDLAEPFGVISQADVDAFVDGFFGIDPAMMERAAALAPPRLVPSQRDASYFSRWFAACGAESER